MKIILNLVNISVLMALSLSSCGKSSVDGALQTIRGQLIVPEGKSLRLNSLNSGQALDIVSEHAYFDVYTDRVVLRGSNASFLFEFPKEIEEQTNKVSKLLELSAESAKLLDGIASRQPVTIFGSKSTTRLQTKEIQKVETKNVGSSDTTYYTQVGDVPILQTISTPLYTSRNVIEKQDIDLSTYRFEFRDLLTGENVGIFIAQVPSTNSSISKILSDWK